VSPDLPERRVVLSGVGMSEVGRTLPHTGMRLACESIQLAVDDAGLSTADIDGIATFPGPTIEYLPGFVGPDIWCVADALRIRPSWHQANFQGSAQMGPIFATVLAVAAGLCRHAVVYRTTTEGSGQRGGHRQGMLADFEAAAPPYDFLSAVGAVSPVSQFAFFAQRYMHEYGLTREQLAAVALTHRAHAALNPWAVLTAPLTLDDYLTARMISTPLCLLDCDLPVDASTAFVVSALDTAADLRAPVRVEAIATALRGRLMWTEWEDMTTMASHTLAPQLWSRTDLRPSDVDTAQLYDGFSIITLMWLEALGFAGRGEAGAFVAEGHTRLGAALPTNTWGGQLSAGRIHGFGYPAEAIRQVRGEAGERQVAGAEVAAVGVGGAHFGGAMLVTAW
jgi:acetyl-CoA acetyltransferase